MFFKSGAPLAGLTTRHTVAFPLHSSPLRPATEMAGLP